MDREVRYECGGEDLKHAVATGFKKEKVERAQRFLSGHGAWLGVFSFLPVLGSAISVALGLMKANLCITFTSITLGKLIRYIALAAGASLVI